MIITITRIRLHPEKTIGKLSINGVFYCFTLEDTVRAPGVKVPSKTAIPAGRYRVSVTWSHRFRKVLPEILGVPGFSGVRIHGGNTEEDTEGCILVGFNLDATKQSIYKTAAVAITNRLSDYVKTGKEPITLIITNPTEAK